MGRKSCGDRHDYATVQLRPSLNRRLRVSLKYVFRPQRRRSGLMVLVCDLLGALSLDVPAS